MYGIIWEYIVSEGNRAEFEQTYRAGGRWVDFFRHGTGYERTELLRDLDDPSRYLTIDYWQSEGDYAGFARANRAEYDRIDQQTSILTVGERQIATFETSP